MIQPKIFHDSFQNFKRYAIPKAQLVIADIPYNIGENAYASNPNWYKDGDNANGESKLAKKSFFNSDGRFKIAEYIDKNALDKALTAAAATGKDKDRRTWAKAICVLHDMPAADVEPLGLWVGSSSSRRDAKKKHKYKLTSFRDSKQRAKTFQGIAAAMAEQWG